MGYMLYLIRFEWGLPLPVDYPKVHFVYIFKNFSGAFFEQRSVLQNIVRCE